MNCYNIYLLLSNIFFYFQRNVTGKCDIPPTAPKKIEEVINECQDEIKIAILAGKVIFKLKVVFSLRTKYWVNHFLRTAETTLINCSWNYFKRKIRV